MIKVGIIGIGGMGRMHFNCYNNNAQAKVAAICDIDPRKLAGDWSSIGLNIDTSKSELIDLSGIEKYADYQELIANPDLDLVDVCLPTPLHSKVTVAALRAGKHVLCEKPMARTLDECHEMEKVARESGRQLMIGHCLRYWPQYVKAHELIASGEYGKPLYARFHRFSASPMWSWNNWLATGSESGGAVLDMHIHDIDTALWWFGKPSSVHVTGLVLHDMPAFVDAVWKYENGPLVNLHGAWDDNGGDFNMSFRVVMEKATVAWDSGGSASVQLYQDQKTTEIAVDPDMGYQHEINDFVACLAVGRTLERVTPAGSRESFELAAEELRQLGSR